MRKKKCMILLLLLLIIQVSINADGERLNYNKYYSYPFSVGVEYQTLTSFYDYGQNFFIHEVYALARWPIPIRPVFQPLARVGIIYFDSRDVVHPDKWDHIHLYGMGGFAFSYRFKKNIELGADVFFGASGALFSNLLPDAGTLSTANLIVEVGGRFGLNPIYNLNIEFNPSVKYLHSLSPLTDFNSVILGLGFSVNFRLGTDPDSNRFVPNSLMFGDYTIDPLFAAMQSYYTKKSIGSITIKNRESFTINDLEVAFFQPEYMNTPTICAKLGSLKPGHDQQIDILSSFNENIFKLEGVTSLTGEIIVTYKSRGRTLKQVTPVNYDLYDKRSIIWDDNRKAASFITPSDSAVRNYAGYINKINDQGTDTIYKNIEAAIKLYHALDVVGCTYQPDPVLPYINVSSDSVVIDNISLPRETLLQKAGDCDDLTVLYCTLLESLGIETGYITTPGHIFPVINTGIPSAMFSRLHPDRRHTINVNGELWVPVEITGIGEDDFMGSWNKAIESWTKWDNEPGNRALYITKEAQKTFRPVGLKELDIGLQYGSKDALVKGYRADYQRFKNLIINKYEKSAASSNNYNDYNILGILYAQFNDYTNAKKAFNRALSINKDYFLTKMNLCHLAYQQKDYKTAIDLYQDLLTEFEHNGNVDSPEYIKLLLCVSVLYKELNDVDNSDKYYREAVNNDQETTENLIAFVGSNDGSRNENFGSTYYTKLFSYVSGE